MADGCLIEIVEFKISKRIGSTRMVVALNKCCRGRIRKSLFSVKNLKLLNVIDLIIYKNKISIGCVGFWLEIWNKILWIFIEYNFLHIPSKHSNKLINNLRILEFYFVVILSLSAYLNENWKKLTDKFSVLIQMFYDKLPEFQCKWNSYLLEWLELL